MNLTLSRYSRSLPPILASFACLGFFASQASGASYIETVDFSNVSNSPTDIKSVFTDFLSGNVITGTLGAADTIDTFTMSLAPNVTANINYSMSGLSSNYVGIYIYRPDTSIVAAYGGFLPGGELQGTFTFVTPAQGYVKVAVSGGASNSSYTLATVPEPTSSLLVVAGLAFSAMHRRRKNA